MDRCEQCAFVYDSVDRAEVALRLRSSTVLYAAHVRAAARDGVERTRPAHDVWSVIEYACHVRDVLAIQSERLQLALTQDQPEFVPMGRERLVVTRRYAEQPTEEVLARIEVNVDDLAYRFEGLTDDQWERTGIYNYPVRAPRTMIWLARHTIHESTHHLEDIIDVTQRVREIRARSS